MIDSSTLFQQIICVRIPHNRALTNSPYEFLVPGTKPRISSIDLRTNTSSVFVGTLLAHTRFGYEIIQMFVGTKLKEKLIFSPLFHPNFPN